MTDSVQINMTQNPLPNTKARIHLHGKHLELQNKQAFYLLAITASAVAYALHRTEQLRLLYWPLFFIGLAVSAWLFSFYLGCKAILKSQNTIKKNIEALEHLDGLYAGKPDKDIYDKTLIDVDNLEKEIEKEFQRQFLLIIAGAGFYALWQIFDMCQSSSAIIIYR